MLFKDGKMASTKVGAALATSDRWFAPRAFTVIGPCFLGTLRALIAPGSRVIIDPTEHVSQPGLGIDVVHFGGDD
jgi:hypothetical protein